MKRPGLGNPLVRLCVVVGGLATATVAVADSWKTIEARLVAAATPAKAANWFGGFGPALPILPPPSTGVAATANDGVPAMVLLSPTGNFVSGPIVCIVDPEGNATNQVLAYPSSFRGGVRVAVGDTNRDGVFEYLTAPAAAAPTIPVRLFTRPGNPSFVGEGFVFNDTFSGGVNVQFADVTGDRLDDVIVAPGQGGLPLVRIFTLGGGARLHSEFFAFEPSFTGGVNIAAGDVDGDGVAEIFAGAATGPAEIRVSRSTDGGVTWREIGGGRVFDSPTSGVFVTAGDVNGDGLADIVAGSGPGSTAWIRAFTLPRTGGVFVAADFPPFESGFTGGVRVAAGDVNGDGTTEIIAGSGPGRAASVRAYAWRNGTWNNQVYRNTTQFGLGYTLGVSVSAKNR